MQPMDVNGVAAIWLASSVLGLAASAYGVIEAIKDLNALQGLTNGRRMVAKQRLFAQGVRAASFFAWVALGIFVLTADTQLTFTVLVLVATNIGYTALAITDAYTGWALRRG